MENLPSLTQTIINLSIQLVQIWIFFGIFVYIYGSKISSVIHQRKIKEHKLANAEIEYDRMIDEAQQESQKILKEALQHKQHIIEEAKELWKHTTHNMLLWAQQEIELLRQEATQQHEHLRYELELWFESMVKQTTHLSLQKLISNKDTKAYNDYLESITTSIR